MMKDIIGKFVDGGPLITTTIFIVFILVIALIARALVQKRYGKKDRALIASLAWFALAWGYMGRTFGLIMAFDNIAAAGEITPAHMAGGLKMALLGPLFGLVTFIVARLGILWLQLKSKEADYE